MKKTSETLLTKPLIVCFLAIFCCFLWGSAAPSIKTGYRLFEIASDDVGSVLLFAGIRFTAAGILVILVCSIINKKVLIPAKKNWPNVLILSLVQTVTQYFFFYMGLANTSGVKGSIIQGANAFIALLIASLIFRMEKLTLQKVIGCLIGFSGVVIINLIGNSIDLNFKWNGEGFILLSMVTYAFSSILIKKYAQTENTAALSGYQFTIGGIILMICGILQGGHLTILTIGSIGLFFYLSALSAVAYTLWGTLLKYNHVGKVTIFTFATPIFGVILSAIILGESKQAFGLAGILSLVLISVGIVIVNRAKE